MMIHNKYKHLLYESERIPESVLKTIDFFDSKSIWFQLSRNSPALSCKDAANKRTRLGYTGIPLSDELKSFFAKVTKDEREIYIVFHCQGNHTLNWNKIQEIIQTDKSITKIPEEELYDYFNMEYGKVNPFNLDPLFLGSENFQIFDSSLMNKRNPPYTMLTNAGDLTWAVEFKPSELINAIDNRMIADIIERSKEYKKQKIGILTGNGPESGIYLWNQINNSVRLGLRNKFYGDTSFPEVVVESIPEMGLSMELDKRENESWEAVRRGVISLCNSGATILSIACNTTQYFKTKIDEICKTHKAKFISIPDVLIKYLKSKDISEFAFLGIKYVTEINKKYSAFKELNKFQIEKISEDSLSRIHELGFEVKKAGISGTGINKLRDLINNETQSSTVVIALTEISILLSTQKQHKKSQKVFIDTLELLAKAVAEEFISSTDEENYIIENYDT